MNHVIRLVDTKSVQESPITLSLRNTKISRRGQSDAREAFRYKIILPIGEGVEKVRNTLDKTVLDCYSALSWSNIEAHGQFFDNSSQQLIQEERAKRAQNP